MVTPTRDRARPASRPDSMSLLTDLFANPLEPEYAEAARRRSGSGSGPAGRTRRDASWAWLVGVVVVGLLLAAAALEVRRSAPVATAERESLIDRIDVEAARAEGLEQQVAELQEVTAELERRRLAGLAEGAELEPELATLQTAAAAAEVSGPGVVVTVQDAPADGTGQVPEGGRVLDLDLQRVVNGLWAAGAEAVEINGQRLTSLTAIRSASDVVLVNYRPLAPPYVLRVIGDPRTMPADFLDGPGGAWLRSISSGHGIRFDVTTVEEMTLPAGGVGTLRHVVSPESP